MPPLSGVVHEMKSRDGHKEASHISCLPLSMAFMSSGVSLLLSGKRMVSGCNMNSTGWTCEANLPPSSTCLMNWEVHSLPSCFRCFSSM